MEKSKRKPRKGESTREMIEEILKADDEAMKYNLEWILDESEAKVEAKGIEKGEKQAKLEMAREMLADGVSVEKITKYTGLTAEEIRHLRLQ